METRTFPLVNPHLEGGPFFWKAGEIGVLLAHGFTATSAEVRPLAQTLHTQGFTVAGPLLPGHGTHPADLNRCRWQEWYAAVEVCYKQLQSHCRRIVVGGESMGALLTLLLASKHPGISAVLSFAPAVRFASRQTSLLAPLVAPFVPFRSKPKHAPSHSDPRWQGYPVNPLRGVVQLLHLQKEVLRNLPAVSPPLLVIQGRQDRSISPLSAEIVYQKAGSVQKELHWFDRSGHCVVIDCDMEAVSSLTLDFLSRVFSE